MWRVFSASATGQRNLEQGAAGQDASHYTVTGDVLVAIVCDGAGSVPEGRTGSHFIACSLAEQLSSTLHAGSLSGLPSEGSAPLEAAIQSAVEAVRTRLADLAASRQLALHDFSCTLVGCVVSPGGGCFFQIGDGFAIAQGAAGDSVLSQPENGEFADETYFVTDEDWKNHLRLTPLPAPERGCVIGLLSDGTAPFAVNRERSGFFRPFIDPIAAFLREATAPNGDAALQNLLQSPRACEISLDDKTLLLAFVL
jgi:Protein phosphatase 2C